MRVGSRAGSVRAVGHAGLERLRERYRELLPAPPFELRAVAWAARGTRP
ncbi:hypothetical protein [Agrococcus sp. Marseille-Q4369]|nr:hypothetical protein [Agrococcus sp. Marseille-Q4369]QUW18824.1 hypothetical protein JSQ78_00085 [Agrococcus sp. Marseille-Q4369]